MSSYSAATIAVARMCEHVTQAEGVVCPHQDLRCELDCELQAPHVCQSVGMMVLQLIGMGMEYGQEDALPCICLELQSILIIHKPAGWEVDLRS